MWISLCSCDTVIILVFLLCSSPGLLSTERNRSNLDHSYHLATKGAKMKGAGRDLLLEGKHQNLKYDTCSSCFLNTGIHTYSSI